MKKILFSVFTCCFLFSSSFAQPEGGESRSVPLLGTIINGSGPRPDTLVLGSNCTETIDFVIQVANLDLHYPGQISNFDLPIGNPPMGLSISFSEPSFNAYYTVPDGSFEYFFTTNTGIQIFQYTIPVTLDFSESCIDTEGLPFTTTWNATLLRDDLPSEFYPICSYTDSTQIFDCNAFEIEYGDCDACSDDQEAVHNGSIIADCTACCGSISCQPCSEERFSIGTFCDFNDDLPCDPCTGVVSGNALTLCVVNEDDVRIYDLGLNAGVGGWTINGVPESGASCITIENFDPNLAYEVCTTITFWLPGGLTCEETICTTIGDCSNPLRSFSSDADTDHSMIEIYPNPVKESLKIKNGYDEQVLIHLISINGKVVTKSSIPSYGNKTLAVQDLSTGLYYMQFRSVGGELLHTERIVVTQ